MIYPAAPIAAIRPETVLTEVECVEE